MLRSDDELRHKIQRRVDAKIGSSSRIHGMTDRSQTELFSFKGNVFLGGCPKSGTTLFLSLLDGHPDLLVFPVELDLFHKVIPKAGDRDWKRMSEYALTRTHLALLAAETPPSETAKP